MLDLFNSDIHGLEVGADDKGCACSSLNVLNGELGMDLNKLDALVGNVHNTHFGDDHIDAVNSGKRKCAFLKDLVVALCGMLHGNDNLVSADNQVHSAAHTAPLTPVIPETP